MAKAKKRKINHVNMKQLFLRRQQAMAEELKAIRECNPHQGSKGSASEICWKTMLVDYLPKRYCAEQAFVIDSDGNCSEQIDIVIFDQHFSPFILNKNDSIFIPAESVYAVIEAKQEIHKGMIEYAAEKAASVRKLKRTSAPIVWAQGTMKRRELHEIPSGIVALESKWNPPLGRPFEKIIKEVNTQPGQRVDFGCAIEHGSFDIEYPVSGDVTFEKSAPDVALISFFLRLVARLQSLGTAPAMDIPEYLKALGPTMSS
jgi:hypothetical protein